MIHPFPGLERKKREVDGLCSGLDGFERLGVSLGGLKVEGGGRRSRLRRRRSLRPRVIRQHFA